MLRTDFIEQRVLVALTGFSLFLIVSTLLLAVVAGLSTKTPLLTKDDWINPVDFSNVTVDRQNTLSDGIARQSTLFLSIRKGSNPWVDIVGRVESKPFLPSPYMIIPVSESLTKSRGTDTFDTTHAKIELQCIANGFTERVRRGPTVDWTEIAVATRCPGQVRLIAETTDDTVRVGVGSPFKVSFPYYLAASSMKYVISYGLASLIILPLTLPFLFFPFHSPTAKASLALLTLGAFGYSSYVLHALNAHPTVTFALVLTFLFVPLLLATRFATAPILPRLGRASLIWLILGAFLTVPLIAIPMDGGMATATFIFTPASWASDNHLSFSIARYVVETTLIHPPAIGLWSVTDRGFVPAGIVAGVMTALAWPPILYENPAAYVVWAMALSLTNAIALFLILTFPSERLSTIAWKTAFVLATPIMFFNTIYTWSKLAAATFLLYAIICFRKNSGALEAGMAFPLLVLGMMFHASVAMLVAPILLYGLVNFYRSDFRNPFPLLAGLVAAVAAGLFHDSFEPKTSYGLTLVLTGTGLMDLSGAALADYLIKFYRSLSLYDVVRMKIDQVGILFWPTLANFPSAFPRADGVLSEIRRAQFWSILPSFALTPLLLFWQRRTFEATLETGIVSSILIAIATIFALWLASFMAFSVHQLPYLLALSVLLLLTLRADEQSPYVRAIFAAQIGLFVLIWVIGSWLYWTSAFD